jgi:Ca-activated chloride channel family protein
LTIRSIYFGFPEALLLLIGLLPVLYLHFYLLRYRKKRLSAFAVEPVVGYLLLPRSSLLTHWKIGLSCAAWIMLCAALMDPLGNVHYLSPPGQASSSQLHDFSRRYLPREVVFLVDTSASMGVRDARQGSNRLDQAKDIMEDTTALLKGEMVSLYSFTSALSPLVPPTYDYLFTRLIIKSLNLNQGDVAGTGFETALKDLKEKIFFAPVQKLHTLIILSDGGDEAVEKAAGAAREEVIKKIIGILPDPAKFHFRVFTIGIGSENPSVIPHVSFEGKPVYSKLEPEILQQLASHFNGSYYAAEDWSSYNLAQELIKKILEEEGQQTEPVQSLERTVLAPKEEDVLYDLYYQVPLGLALVLLSAYLLLPDVRRS